MANFRLWFVHRKWNVLSKLVVPRVQLSMRYITSELEEIEREDNFRLKRFKELKYKNKKDDNANKCYCKKQPGKGDDFVCVVCKQNEERNQKKSPCVTIIEPGIEVIGDKASSVSSVNQKRLDNLNAQLEKVISLTSQCKYDGLVSQSVEKLIHVCQEVRCKLDTDQKQTTADEQASQSCCNSVKDEVQMTVSQETLHKTSKEPEKKQDEKEDDSLGYFETKFKETIKIMKFKNEDGTISEERQVVTIKTEKKHPHKPNEFGMSPCCKVRLIASITSEESGSDSRDGRSKHPTKTKSEEIPYCMNKEQTKVRSCISDSGSRENRKEVSNKPIKVKSKMSSLLKCCKGRDAATDPEPPSEPPEPPVCCPRKSPSGSLSNKSTVSMKICKNPSKSIKKEPAKKDVACEHKTEVKTVCCDSMWKDVATSTTGLAESSEEVEELSICMKGPDEAEPAVEVGKESIGKIANISIKISYDKESDKAEKKKSSQICSICSQCSQSMKDTSTTTSKTILEQKSLKNKPSSIKNLSCLSPSPEIKKSSSKIDKRPKSGSKDTKPDERPKTCCKVRIISKQIGSKEKNVEEFVFFGNILDAIKKILAPNKSDECFIKTQDSKETNGTKPFKNSCPLCNKSSFMPSVCKSCESSKVPKGVGKSQSCPQCSEKNVEKSISWSRPRSRSAEAAKKTPKPCSCMPRPDIIPMCSVCGSKLSKESNTASDKVEDDECLSCEIESCPLSTTASSVTDLNDEASVCPSKHPPIKPSESKCKTCLRDKAHRDTLKNEAKPKCKTCYPEEDQCCQTKDQRQEAPKKTKDSESKCDVCHRSKAQCVCYPNNKASESKCDVCHRSKAQCVCYPKNIKMETEPSKPKNKTCFSGDNQNTTKSTQTGIQDTKKPETKSGCNLCPLCSKEDQKSKEQNRKSNSVPHKSSNLCCDTSRVNKDEIDCKNCNGVAMKDASTSTRRSDRYDVRPLNMMKPAKKMTCTCYSDSYMTKRSPQPPKRCSSCHANYYKC